MGHIGILWQGCPVRSWGELCRRLRPKLQRTIVRWQSAQAVPESGGYRPGKQSEKASRQAIAKQRVKSVPSDQGRNAKSRDRYSRIDKCQTEERTNAQNFEAPEQAPEENNAFPTWRKAALGFATPITGALSILRLKLIRGI